MTHYPIPPYYAPEQAAPQRKGVSGFGIAALVIGIVALLVAWVPFCGMAAIPVASIGLILAIVGFIVSISGGRSTVGMSIAGAVVCLIAIIVPVVVTSASMAFFGAAAEKARKEAAARQAALQAQLATQPATAPAVDPTELLQSYTDDALSTDAQYKGAFIELTGTVARIGTEPSGQRHLIFAPDPTATGRVQCFLSRETAAQFSTLRHGQSVTVRGRVEGMSGGNVVVRDCVVVQ